MIKKNLSLVITVMMILASVTLLFSATTIDGHSPSDVSIEYDKEVEELTVSITHSVGDPQSHYIYNVVVEVDGDTVIDEDYNEQPDDTSFQYTYDLSVDEGSNIEATVYCIQAGSNSATLVVGEEEDGDTPGFTTIVLLLSVIIAAAIFYKIR
ncbi:MAG: hypothetical protein ACOC85_05025 [Thermoplasmatota archaeon]